MTDEDVRDGVALLVVEAVLVLHVHPEVGGGRGALRAAPAIAPLRVGVVRRDLVPAAAAALMPNAQAAATLTVVVS